MNYVEQMHAEWQKDPSRVHASWNAYFSNLQRGVPGHQAVAEVPSKPLAPKNQQIDADDLLNLVNQHVNEVRTTGHF